MYFGDHRDRGFFHAAICSDLHPMIFNYSRLTVGLVEGFEQLVSDLPQLVPGFLA